MMDNEAIEKMDNGKDKKLMEILAGNAKPFVKKCDGYATKVTESQKIEYEDYDGQKLTLEVPEGSYIVVNEGSTCPKIVPADEFEKKNKIIDGEKKAVVVKEDKSPKLGMESIMLD